jgi:nucleoside-diphosphate-sugar epimerase
VKNQLNLRLEELWGSRILITGASGWLGLESLCLLNQQFPNLQNLKLTLVGNNRKSVRLHDIDLEITPLREIPLDNTYDLILHFAFATQDKATTLGASKYVDMNMQLNEWISLVNFFNPDAKKLILSSGAVSKFAGNGDEHTSMGLYSSLKKDLESRFMDEKSLILRLWNTSGHHMGADTKYALGEFVKKALAGEKISVGKNLNRTYVASSSVLHSSIFYLLNGGSGVVNSGGILTNLFDLAELTAKVLNSCSECVLELSGNFSDLDYISPISEIPKEFWLESLSLEDQIRNVALGINQNL